MKSSENSCHGSNNCYVWALDVQQCGKRNDETRAGAIKTKCLSTTTKHDKDDIECLLLNEHTNQCESNASEQTSDQFDETDESHHNNQRDMDQDISSVSSKP